MTNPSTGASTQTAGYRFSLPQGWTFLTKDAPAPTMTCPEGDLHVSFVEMEAAGTAQETALSAWRKLDPAFDAKVLQEYPATPDRGWHKVHQALFATPASESRVQIAIIRTLGSRAYVNLIQGTNASAARPWLLVKERSSKVCNAIWACARWAWSNGYG